MAKVMVSLPDDVLRTLDLEAERRGMTRSGLLRELAETSLNRRSLRRAEQMRAISRTAGGVSGHGGRVAEVLQANRPQR